MQVVTQQLSFVFVREWKTSYRPTMITRCMHVICLFQVASSRSIFKLCSSVSHCCRNDEDNCEHFDEVALIAGRPKCRHTIVPLVQ